jgi:hypothetical protein
MTLLANCQTRLHSGSVIHTIKCAHDKCPGLQRPYVWLREIMCSCSCHTER